MERGVAAVSTTMVSGFLRLGFFQAQKTEVVNNIIVPATVAAAATPTLCRMGLYSVNAITGDLTLIGASVNDTSLWSLIGWSPNIRALNTAVRKQAGSWYGIGGLAVTGVAVPAVACATTILGAVPLGQPAIALAAQADLPAFVPVASVLASANSSIIYGAVTP